MGKSWTRPKLVVEEDIEMVEWVTSSDGLSNNESFPDEPSNQITLKTPYDEIPLEIIIMLENMLQDHW
jgi:hypothetical protein